MSTSRTPGTGHDAHGRPMPPPAGLNAAPDDMNSENSIGLSGAGMVGHKDAGLDETRRMSTGTTHEAPERNTTEREGAGERDLPIGSALASGEIRGAGNPAAGTDADLTSGPSTLGATTGGERAVAGRADANRNSRDHGSSRD